MAQPYFATLTPEQRSVMAKKGAATRRAKRSATPPAEMPPDVPTNYGRLREVGKGGAIDAAARDLGGLGEAVATPPGAAPSQPPAEPRMPLHRTPSQLAPAHDVLTLPDWETIEPHEGQQVLDTLYKILEGAARVIQRRLGQQEAVEGYKCETCGISIPSVAQAKMVQDSRDPTTRVYQRRVWCSGTCFTRYVSEGRQARPAAPGAALTRREGE